MPTNSLFPPAADAASDAAAICPTADEIEPYKYNLEVVL